MLEYPTPSTKSLNSFPHELQSIYIFYLLYTLRVSYYKATYIQLYHDLRITDFKKHWILINIKMPIHTSIYTIHIDHRYIAVYR
jgi:phosphopantetheinyl transferase